MAIHLGKQERLSGFARYAVIFCRIADGPKWHKNSNPQLHHGVETMKGACNFEASFNRASTIFPLLGLSWGNTQVAGSRTTEGKDTHRNVFNWPLFHNIGDPYTGSRRWIFWGWPVATYRSCESWTALRESTAWFTHAQNSVTTWEREAVAVYTWLQGSKTSIIVRLSQIAADSANIAMPVLEKKFLWVKCGLLTKSCTQSRAPRISSSQIITRSRLTMNLSLEVTGPRTIAVSRNTWKNKTVFFRLKRSQGSTMLVAIQTLNRCWRAQKPACEEQNDRTSPTSGRPFVEDRPSCRCFWTKDWYSARQASFSLPLIHPRSQNPSNKRPSRCSGTWLSLPMTIAGQKQLNPCPILERAATVDSTEFVNSPEIYGHPFGTLVSNTNLLRAANTRVANKNAPSAIGGNFEWFASTFCSHCSRRGN